MNVRHQRFLSVLILFLIGIFPACGSKSGGTGSVPTTPDMTTNFSGTPVSTAPAGADPVTGMSNLLTQAAPLADTPEKTTALGQAQTAVSAFGSALGQLRPGMSMFQIAPRITQLLQATQNFHQIALLFQNAGWPQLAQVFEQIAHRRPVFRFYEPGHHFFTLSASEGNNAPAYKYEGIGFFVSPDQTDDWDRPLYRCYVPSADDHFVSVAANCEGQQFEGQLGFIAGERRGNLIEPRLQRLYLRGDHLITPSSAEAQSAQAQGFALEGTLGFSL